MLGYGGVNADFFGPIVAMYSVIVCPPGAGVVAALAPARRAGKLNILQAISTD